MAEASAKTSQGTIETLDEFLKDSKKRRGQYYRWQTEVDAAIAACKDFQTKGSKVVNRFLAKGGRSSMNDTFRLNLFHANIKVMQAMMFGKLPEITFSRTHADPNDDPARVAGMMFERMLNADIGTPNDQYSRALQQNLQDRLLPGLGVARVRYEFDEKELPVEPIKGPGGNVIQIGRFEKKITAERAPLDYVHWRDFIWSPARVWSDVRWVAFRTLLTKDQAKKRFGAEFAKHLNFSITMLDDNEEKSESPDESQDAWKRAEVWEIWCKADRNVYWFHRGYDQILDIKPDPLKLSGFFPIPEPLAANLTTTAYMPKADYTMAEDLYNACDELENRIQMLTDAIKVVGVYDQSAGDTLKNLLTTAENDLVPVDNWAMFAEKGGLQGVIEWLPIKEIAETLMLLVDRRNDTKALLMEVTGTADIMRGAKQAGGAVTATERALEARFASVQIQALQDAFARYATDLIRLRAEVIAQHFSPESIFEQSNAQALTHDQQLVPQAVELMKKSKSLVWRIEVKPESVAMVDYAQLKEERTAYITALATFLQSAAPLAEQSPEAVPILMEMLKWGLAGFKGSQQVEGILDQAINQMQNAQQQGQGQEQPSDAQIKAQMEAQKQEFEKLKLQATQQFEREKWQAEQQRLQLEGQLRERELAIENNNNIRKEQAQAQLNMQEERTETEEFIKREEARARINPPQATNNVSSGKT